MQGAIRFGLTTLLRFVNKIYRLLKIQKSITNIPQVVETDSIKPISR